MYLGRFECMLENRQRVPIDRTEIFTNKDENMVPAGYHSTMTMKTARCSIPVQTFSTEFLLFYGLQPLNVALIGISSAADGTSTMSGAYRHLVADVHHRVGFPAADPPKKHESNVMHTYKSL